MNPRWKRLARLEQIAPLTAQVRSAGGVAPLASMLRDWHARLSARSRAMLTGAAALDAYLGGRPAPPQTGEESLARLAEPRLA